MHNLCTIHAAPRPPKKQSLLTLNLLIRSKSPPPPPTKKCGFGGNELGSLEHWDGRKIECLGEGPKEPLLQPLGWGLFGPVSGSPLLHRLGSYYTWWVLLHFGVFSCTFVARAQGGGDSNGFPCSGQDIPALWGHPYIQVFVHSGV